MEEKKKNKYCRTIYDYKGKESIKVDVYSVLDAFSVTDSATAHAIKKLLCPGQRGVKSKEQDLKEAKQSIERAIISEKVKSTALDTEEGWVIDDKNSVSDGSSIRIERA